MAVFANEGNVSQDANFRRHLDDNWDSGNREFDKIERLLDTLKGKINDYQVDALIKRINELNETIKEQDARISKLEGVVFGLATADITTPPTPDYPNSGMIEVNFDDRKDKKDKW